MKLGSGLYLRNTFDHGCPLTYGNLNSVLDMLNSAISAADGVPKTFIISTN